MGVMDSWSLPGWLQRAHGYVSGDHVVRLADDPTRPDPVKAEAERLERQKVRESQAAQAAERDLLESRLARDEALAGSEAGWVAPGEVLTRFPRVAERLAQGMAPPTFVAYGPADEARVEALWQKDMARVRLATLNANGIVERPL